MKNFNHFIFSILLTVKVAAGLLSLVEVETNQDLVCNFLLVMTTGMKVVVGVGGAGRSRLDLLLTGWCGGQAGAGQSVLAT